MRKARPSRGELQEYRRRRDFAITSEPAGQSRTHKDAHRFVVQKHDATALHYDFRLEVDGVLKSWAVPKGPSLDPAQKRLAVQTEDHPLEYATFEGTIPEGEYGGGRVLVWDRGTWFPEGDPQEGLRAGKLSFVLEGEKLHGGWSLLRLKGRGRGRSWLLIKRRDRQARPVAEFDVTREQPGSVVSGRSLERVRHSSGVPGTRPIDRKGRRTNLPARARRRPIPPALDLQLATLVDSPPNGNEWLHEIKFDGYRIAARRDKGAVRLVSRNGKDWTERFPAIAGAVGSLPARGLVLDGEVAVRLPGGATAFNALQNVQRSGGRLVYFVFDMLYLDGYDLTPCALEDRKKMLKELLPGTAGVLRYSDHVVGSGLKFLRKACARSLEGIVSKRREAPYRPGRGRDWLKVKCLHEQEFVIVGFTDPRGAREGIGALLLGVNDSRGSLLYAGKVGTGFSAAAARSLRKRLAPLERSDPPLAQPPRIKGAHWVRAKLVAQVAFSEWTPAGRLRHPAFRGLREDKDPADVVAEVVVRSPATER
jgi:bifunctional non-homologous end joining protein LigD